MKELMDKVMVKVLYEDPFVPEKHHASKPIYAALVPDEIFKGAHFERRFVTPFGGVWEKLAVTVARVFHGDCRQGVTINGLVKEERPQRIQQVLNELEHGMEGHRRKKPEWDTELSFILSGKGNPIPVAVTCDIFIDSKTTGKKYALELKAPLPNSDQTKVSKEKIFKLLAMEPMQVDNAYYALVYNPYGKRQNYEWSFPMRWFDMKNDPSVLIGDEFWDLIGGSSAYRTFIHEINALGKEYKERIYRDFLGIEPPENTGSFLK
ncbi:MAG: TdeIII family type II restriction endonuclease [Victivallales bacterium]|nr:TdeIII family type II restriction endonuclease [Victivallales bacterium]